MEAPEVIYRTTTYLDSDRGKTVWKIHPVPGAENIEYVRKDAFIERAYKFFKERLFFDDSWHVEGEDCMLDKVIKDFKEYIKGE